MEPSLIPSRSTRTSAASDLTLRRRLTRTDISSAQRAKRNTRLGGKCIRSAEAASGCF